VHKHFWNGSVRGQEKYAFLYVAISAVALAVVMTYSGLAGLVWWQSLLLLLGGLIGAWATLFSVLEVRRLAQPSKSGEAQVEAEAYPPRTIVVAPPTGDPYPHHEEYAESSGFDQGQLTSRIPDETPFTGKFLGRRNKKEVAAR
jgi:hypothetical protein